MTEYTIQGYERAACIYKHIEIDKLSLSVAIHLIKHIPSISSHAHDTSLVACMPTKTKSD